MDQPDIESTHIDAVKNLRSRFEQLAHNDTSPPVYPHRLSTITTTNSMSNMTTSSSSLHVPESTTPTRLRTLSKSSDDNGPIITTNSHHLRTASSSSDIKSSARRPPPPPPPHAQSSSRAPSPSPSLTSPRSPRTSPLLRPVSSSSSLRQASPRPSLAPLVSTSHDLEETIDSDTPTASVAALRSKFLSSSPSLSSPATTPTIGKLNVNGFHHSLSDTAIPTHLHMSPPTIIKPPLTSRAAEKMPALSVQHTQPLIPDIVSSPDDTHSRSQSLYSSSPSIEHNDPFSDYSDHSSSEEDDHAGPSRSTPPALPARKATNNRPSASSSSSRTSSESDGVSSKFTSTLALAPSKPPVPPPRLPPRHPETTVLSPATSAARPPPSRPPLPARRPTITQADDFIVGPPKLPQRQGTAPPPPPLATHPSLAGQHSQYAATAAASVTGTGTIYSTELSASASTSALLGERKALGSSKLPPPPTRTIALGDKLPPVRKDKDKDKDDDDSEVESLEEAGEEGSASKSDVHMDPDTTRVSRRPPFLMAREGDWSGNVGGYGFAGRPEWIPRMSVPAHFGQCAFTNNWIVASDGNGGVAIYDIAYSLDKPRMVVGTKQIGVKEAKITAIEVRGSGIVTPMPIVTGADTKGKGKLKERGCYVWIGTKDGHLVELDCRTGDITGVKHSAHLHPIIHIFRHGASMISIDDSGKVLIFSPPPDSSPEAIETGEVRLLTTTPRVIRITDKLDFCVLLGGCLWTGARSEQQSLGTGPNTKTPIIRIYDLFTPGSVGKTVMPHLAMGPPTCATILPTRPGYVYMGHEQGYITIWDVGGGADSGSVSPGGTAYSYAYPQCADIHKIQVNDVISMQGVNNRLWVGSRNGFIAVYDVSVNPWMVTNMWPAYTDMSVVQIMVDPWGVERLGRLGVLTVGRDGKVGLWDGLLSQDWLDKELIYAEPEYSRMRDLKILMVSWNCDAAKPDALVQAGGEANLNFLSDVLRSVDSPDIISFGFQEIIDLESRKLAAKSVVYGRSDTTKKKDGPYVKGSLFEFKEMDEAIGSNSNTLGLWDKVSSSYRRWHDQLVLAVKLAMPANQPYSVVYTQSMVGLFSCIFVKQSERSCVRSLGVTSIKRGMGGRYGNKGGIVSRFVFQDTSICFVNCHLAAGQTSQRSRNADIAGILESERVFNPVPEPLAFLGGGDGSMIMDHEMVFVSGDLNYRIDLRRDVIIAAVRTGDFESMYSHDQLLKEVKSRGCRLRAFTEGPLKFAPTYKYDRRTDVYDSSEKHRAPAWCDRILWRSKVPDRVKQLFYKRHEVNVSDHRPISSAFTVSVKTVKDEARQRVKAGIQMKWVEKQRSLLSGARDFYASHLMM